MLKKLLPVGSVVLLNGGTKKTVIIGVMQIKTSEENKIYDYQGVPYPEGYMGIGTSYLFNHEQIAEVVFQGYDDEERKQFLEVVEILFNETQKTISQAAEQEAAGKS